MKTITKLIRLSILAGVAFHAPSMAGAEPAGAPVRENSASPHSAGQARAAAAGNSRHRALCAMLGLKVGRTYEFMISGNNEVHYWTIRSLGPTAGYSRRTRAIRKPG